MWVPQTSGIARDVTEVLRTWAIMGAFEMGSNRSLGERGREERGREDDGACYILYLDGYKGDQRSGTLCM